MRNLSDRHIAELDGVRGIACLLVVLMHCGLGITKPELGSWQPIAWKTLSPFMVGGVDLFFVLSGFLIGGILIDHKTAPNYFKVFWIRRAARILPVYLLLLLTYMGALALRPLLDIPWADKWLLGNPLPLWGYATFTANNVMAYCGQAGARWIGIAWSLAVEEQFYLLFPFVVYFLKRRTVVAIAVTFILFAPFVRLAGWYLGGNFYSGYMPTPGRVDALMFGFLVAYAVRSHAVLILARRWRAVLDAAALACVVAVSRILTELPLTLEYSLLGMIFAWAILRIYVSGGPFREFCGRAFSCSSA